MIDYWDDYPPPGESLAKIVKGFLVEKDAEPSMSWEDQKLQLSMWSSRLKR